ncbi:MAG: hypothetical protein REI78_14185 [Pedobacter sp.]|nr:hypothetical protein [Pedobacter sp.]MDQ8054180.1 hypothetical protein [Pedobacter sp.]
MKHKLFLTIIFIVGLFVQESIAQTSPTVQQPISTRTTPGQVPVKKWRATAKAPVQANTTVLPRKTIDTVKNTDFSLNGQYQFLLSRSRSINGYKLMNPTRLAAVWKSVMDTLAKERAELKQSKAAIAEQTGKITTLQAEVKGNESEVQDVNAKMDEINFLGISFSKGTYNIVVWSIILILAIALFVVVARSGKNILEAKHRTQLYEEITTEYQQYKAKASEKERKLARELQDERNMVEELKNNARG